MNILLFGVSNVGKTTAGELLARELGYQFFDLDEEVKKYYETSLEDFVNTGSLENRDCMRGEVIDEILKKEEDKVVAITPISYSEVFRQHLRKKDVLAIEMRDTPEHIFDRLVFSDENDNIYTDDEYKNRYKDHYIAEIEDVVLCQDLVQVKMRKFPSF